MFPESDDDRFPAAGGVDFFALEGCVAAAPVERRLCGPFGVEAPASSSEDSSDESESESEPESSAESMKIGTGVAVGMNSTSSSFAEAGRAATAEECACALFFSLLLLLPRASSSSDSSLEDEDLCPPSAAPSTCWPDTVREASRALAAALSCCLMSSIPF